MVKIINYKTGELIQEIVQNTGYNTVKVLNEMVLVLFNGDELIGYFKNCGFNDITQIKLIRHNIYGPAINDKDYYIHNIKYTYKDWLVECRKIKLSKISKINTLVDGI